MHKQLQKIDIASFIDIRTDEKITDISINISYFIGRFIVGLIFNI